jgi:hypothetical protein
MTGGRSWTLLVSTGVSRWIRVLFLDLVLLVVCLVFVEVPGAVRTSSGGGQVGEGVSGLMLKVDGHVGYWRPELDMVSCDFWSSWWAIEKATLNLTYCWQTFPELALIVEQSGFEYKLIGKGGGLIVGIARGSRRQQRS